MLDIEEQVARYARAAGELVRAPAVIAPIRPRKHWIAVAAGASVAVAAALAVFVMFQPSGPTSEPVRSGGSSATSDPRASAAGVNVTVTGVARQGADGLELCPADRRCAGLRLLTSVQTTGRLMAYRGQLTSDGLVLTSDPAPAAAERVVPSVPDSSEVERLLAALLRIPSVYSPSVRITGSGGDLVVAMYASDASVEEAVRSATSGSAVVTAFISVLDGSITDLPAAPEGEINLDVQPAPVPAGAFGRLTVELSYDAGQGCVYGARTDTGERVGLRWPYGYTATDNPVSVRDFDGRVVASVGEVVHLAGGLKNTTGKGACGADATFVITG